MEPEIIFCPCCRTTTVVEVPPCADDHGVGCPDRACTVCGTALTKGGQPMWTDAALDAALDAGRSAQARSAQARSAQGRSAQCRSAQGRSAQGRSAA